MLDFVIISTKITTRGIIEIYPKFIIKKSQDVMIRGGDFYAIWVEEKGLWSTDEDDLSRLIDKELDKFAESKKAEFGNNISIKYMWDADSGTIDRWHKYCQKQTRDNYHMLDESLLFSNDSVDKKHYSTKRLSYPLAKGSIESYDKLIGTLYSAEERHKIEWAIGAIVTGDSKTIQKFLVLYGAAGTGKSTILNIIQKLFDGYYSVFDAKALGSSGSQFALEAFRNNPLVAIQHDGDLSKIEDNTRLNSLVSHETMIVNEKYTKGYENAFKAFLFLGTNRPVKITDAKSGLIRRLIDVSPTGDKIPPQEYKRLIKKIDFELGAIAWHCKEVYEEDPGYYDDYIPMTMMSASNDFYNFVIDSYHIFKKEDGVGLAIAWEMYKTYAEDAKLQYSITRRIFKEELKNYFREFDEDFKVTGEKINGYYSGFRTEKFVNEKRNEPDKIDILAEVEESHLIKFDCDKSIFDTECSDCLAQYANDNGTPTQKWENVTTKLSEIDTSKVHYVKIPEHHIVIDFDIPDENGEKSFERNLKEASKWPATYAELSKSGAGIHLHYFYQGDSTRLSRIYDDHIEIKVFTGNSSLRRKLTKCNNLPIASISSGLPLKGDKKMADFNAIKSEKGLRRMIQKNLNKEFHAGTKPSIDFIYTILEEAHENGLKYDVTDMRNAVFAFGANSTHQSDYCIKLINKMKFKSEDTNDSVMNNEAPIVFVDVEVFPNLFLVNWKIAGEGKAVVRLINPKPAEIEELLQFRLVGFNNRSYDNHMLYACMMGYDNEQLYNLSSKIINRDSQVSRQAKFGEAFNLSYTDVYDFAAKKQSLKKWEIELGIHHQELGLPWDQPVPEEKWTLVAEYCDNDVLATEAVFNHLKADFVARQILADLAGGTVNDTTNSLTTKIIFGKDRNPQNEFNYRNMGEENLSDVFDVDDEYTRFNDKGQPIFPGYKYEFGKSTYRGEEVGEGGYVYSEPGIYGNVALLDIASMHPSSIIAENLFGKYTKRFKDIRDGRVIIKHEDWEQLNDILDGKLTPYIQKVINREMTSKDLSNALKIAINSVYGLTSAKFPNPFKDPRNVDNLVAKRGALFMINLKHQVQAKGFTVAHIKTDSIKIPDATPEIIQFVMDYGARYGYTFENEATYDRMCLVNDAVYIAKYDSGEWTATGTQFQVPYVFKTLFSKEPIEFNDMCETKSVSKGSLYLDMNEGLDSDPLEEELNTLRKLHCTIGDLSDDNAEIDQKRLERLKNKYEQLGGNKRLEEIQELTPNLHNYVFIGRVGQFCPVKPGCGGGVLYRENEGKYFAATGTKGYRWLESEVVKELGKENDIDKTYYAALVDAAVEEISKYGDFEWFVSDEPYIKKEVPSLDIITDPLPEFA